MESHPLVRYFKNKPIPSTPTTASLLFRRPLLALAFTISIFSPFLDQNTLLEQPRHRILRQSQRVDQSSHTDTQTPQPEVEQFFKFERQNTRENITFNPKNFKIVIDISPLLPPDTDNIWNSPRGEDTCCCLYTGADHHHHHCYQRPECPG